jgi:formate dehydrogenase alpha subunit
MISWDEALELVAERLTGIKKKHGPQSLGLLGSSKCSNEENYLFQKMGRAILGTNNVDNGSYLAGRPTLKPVIERLEGAGHMMPLSGLERAEVIFAVGANPTHSVPVVSYYMKRAASMQGIPMIVVDPRKTGLVPFSSLWLPINPKSDSELINALAAILLRSVPKGPRVL